MSAPARDCTCDGHVKRMRITYNHAAVPSSAPTRSRGSAMSDPERMVILPYEVVSALFFVYQTWWHEVGPYDPGSVLVSDGVRLYDISALLDTEDDQAMDAACRLVEPHEEMLRTLLAGETR